MCRSTKVPSDHAEEKPLIIIPAESRFARKEWKTIIDGASQGASENERRALRKVIASKFPVKRQAKPGPKSSEPADLARTQHQKFIWLLAEILKVPKSENNPNADTALSPDPNRNAGKPDEEELDWTEAKVCARACTVLHNFNTFCEQGAFLLQDEFHKISLSKWEEVLDEREADFLAEVSQMSRCRRMSWASLGRLAHTGKEEQGFGALDASVLLNEVLPELIGAEGSEFRVFAHKRRRTSKAGRPKNRQWLDLRIPGWDGRERIVTMNGDAEKTEEKLSEAPPPESSPEPLPSPPPSEEEVFRKVAARLLTVKNLVYRRVPINLCAETWELVRAYQQESWWPAQGATRDACDILWRAATRQPIMPLGDYFPAENAGRFVDISEFGVLEIDP